MISTRPTWFRWRGFDTQSDERGKGGRGKVDETHLPDRIGNLFTNQRQEPGVQAAHALRFRNLGKTGDHPWCVLPLGRGLAVLTVRKAKQRESERVGDVLVGSKRDGFESLPLALTRYPQRTYPHTRDAKFSMCCHPLDRSTVAPQPRALTQQSRQQQGISPSVSPPHPPAIQPYPRTASSRTRIRRIWRRLGVGIRTRSVRNL